MEYDISVIVPVYNAEPYIVKCLESIMKQTVSRLELICVNDGSKDRSLEELKKYQAENQEIQGRKIIIIDKENGGPSAARNAGLLKATGKYVAFVDSDDYIESTMYQDLIETAEKQNLNVVLCNIINSYPNGSHVQSEVKVPQNQIITRKEILELICPTLMREDIFGGPCNRIYRRDFLISNKIRMPEELGYGEDAVFQMKVFDLLQATWFDAKCYYHYVHREGSQSSAKPARLASTLEPLYKIRCVYGKKWGIEQRFINHYFIYCAIMDLVATLGCSNMIQKLNYLKYFLRNKSLKAALSDSDISKEMYTKKIYYVYRVLKFVM